MKYAIDETALARLEELAAHYANVVTLDNVSIPHKIIKSVPALIAEVRRLREIVDDDIKKRIRMEFDLAGMSETLDEAISENDALREKVEAREWLWECFNLWLSMPSMPTITEDGRVELWYIRKAAREAVHADRE